MYRRWAKCYHSYHLFLDIYLFYALPALYSDEFIFCSIQYI